MPEINFNDYFYYDETSPSCLRWKVDRRGGIYGNGNLVASKGDAAGCKDTLGYFTVGLKQKIYKAHRIVWVLHNGQIDDRHIDHIDGNPSNNNILNLRLVCSSINKRNQKKNCKNSSGVQGVIRVVSRGVYYWRASWYRLDTRKRTTKAFSVAKYGEQKAFQLACEYRGKMIEELNKQGAGYTKRHGA